MLLIQIVVRTYDPKTMLDINVELNVTVQCPPQVEKQCTDTGGSCDMSRKFKKTKFQVEEALKSVKKLQNEVEKKCDNEGGPRWRRSRGWTRGWQFFYTIQLPHMTWMTTETFVIYTNISYLLMIYWYGYYSNSLSSWFELEATSTISLHLTSSMASQIIACKQLIYVY